MNDFLFSTPKKAVYFDLNGTLIDSNRAFFQSLKEALEPFTGRLADEQGRQVLQQAIRRYKLEWSKRYPGKKKVGFSEICLYRALEPYSFPGSPSFIAHIAQQVRERKKAGFFTDAETLETVANLNTRYLLGIISNGNPETANKYLEKTGLKAYFPSEHVFVFQDPKMRKPGLRIFSKALKTLGVIPSEAVMVGDSWKNDIQGAVLAGMDAVWLRKRTVSKSPLKFKKRVVVVVKNIKEILDFL